MRSDRALDQNLRTVLGRGDPGAGCPMAESWIELLQGELPSERAEELRGHLEICSECAGVAAQARRFLIAMGELAERPARGAALRGGLGLAAALAVLAIGLLYLFGGERRTPLGAVERLAAALEVAAPPAPSAATDRAGLIYRGTAGESPGAAALAGALAPYRERRFADACVALTKHGGEFPEDREARFLAAVACLKAGELDRADTLLASLAAVVGDRQQDARSLLESLRRARREDDP